MDLSPNTVAVEVLGTYDYHVLFMTGRRERFHMHPLPYVPSEIHHPLYGIEGSLETPPETAQLSFGVSHLVPQAPLAEVREQFWAAAPHHISPCAWPRHPQLRERLFLSNKVWSVLNRKGGYGGLRCHAQTLVPGAQLLCLRCRLLATKLAVPTCMCVQSISRCQDGESL